MRWRSGHKSEEAMRCSFCHKSQDVVRKLISGPNDYPRAYICDECVAVCNSILGDDRDQRETAVPDTESQTETSSLLDHPLASELLTAVQSWIRRESSGADAADEIDKMEGLALRMMRTPEWKKGKL